jgi:transcription initiation factor TFIID subunit 9B
VPNKPPPGVKLYDEEIEMIEESESSDDEDMEPAPIPLSHSQAPSRDHVMKDVPRPQLLGPVTSSAVPNIMEDGSDGGEEEDGLFAGGDEGDGEEEEDSGAEEAMEEVQVDGSNANGIKRKLVEEDDYD